VIRPLLLLAAEEFQEGLRNRWVISSVLLLAILAFSLALLGTSPIGETRVGALNVTTVSLASLSVYLLPLIALTLSYDAVVGERERGTLLLLLTYPISRWQVICGKFLGHFTIIAVAILLGYGMTGVYIAVTDSAPAQDWLLFAAMLGSTLMLGSAFIALGYLISVTVSSRATAAGIAISVWLLVVVIYDLLLLGLVLSDAGKVINSDMFGALLLLNPADIYRLFNLAGSEAASLVSGTLGTMDSSFLSSGLLLSVLCLWIIVPIAISIWVFNRHEL
jgi:Cu-processing system permease protein